MAGTTIIMEKFDPERALTVIEEHKITHSQWVPIMFVRMLKLPAELRCKYDCSSMKIAIHAAAPCPIEIKEQMIDWWGPVIFEYYSGSEGAGMTMIDSASWMTHKGSVGPAMTGELHIVDEEGNEVACGETGTVYFGNGSKFEYYGEPEKTAGAYNEQGWANRTLVRHPARRSHRHDDREYPPVHGNRASGVAFRNHFYAHKHPPEEGGDPIHPAKL